MFGFDRNDIKLIINFTKINISDRYMASTLGAVWSVLNPIILFTVFTFVFGFVFKAKLPGANTTLSYATWLISGYGPWLAISEGIILASTSIISNSGIVKNLAIKTEILPIASVFTTIVSLATSLIFLVILLTIDGNYLTWHFLILIPIVILQFYFIVAIGYYLAAISVFIRDVSIVLPNLLLILLFMTPIFYPIDSMPRIIQMMAFINPFYILAEAYRNCLIYHTLSKWIFIQLAYVAILSSLLHHYGLKLFRRAKGHFASAL